MEPMTYQTRQDKHKRHLECVMPIIFTASINVCYAAYLYYFKDVDFWQAVKQVSVETLSFLLMMLFGLSLAFVCLLIGRLIKRARNKGQSNF